MLQWYLAARGGLSQAAAQHHLDLSSLLPPSPPPKGWGESIIIGVAGAGQEVKTRPFQRESGESFDI